MKEGTHLTLKDGREILLQDDEDIFLSVRSGHETLSSYPFTCPSGGYGGGTLLLVCRTLFLGVGHREAQAINLLFFLPTAGISLFFHRKNGFLDRETWRDAAPLGTAAALAGALVSMAVDVSLLRKPFGVFLLYGGASMLLGAVKRGGRR